MVGSCCARCQQRPPRSLRDNRAAATLPRRDSGELSSGDEEEFHTPPTSGDEGGGNDDRVAAARRRVWSEFDLAAVGCPAQHWAALRAFATEMARHPPPHTHAHTDTSLATLHRFLAARDYRVSRASRMFAQHVAWRAQTLPIAGTPTQMAALQAAELQHSLIIDAPHVGGQVAPPRRFYRVHQQPEPGHRADEVICVVLREWVDLRPEVLDDALMAYVAFIEATAARVDRHDPEPEQRQWTLICDCAGLGLSSVPLSFLKQINRIFEPNYPHRLRKSVMVPIPRIVTKMVSAMMVFVAESTRRKFVMVRSSAELAEAVGMPPSQLPASLADFS